MIKPLILDDFDNYCNISGESFIRLLDLCFNKCSVLSFNKSTFDTYQNKEKVDAFLKSLEPFHITTLYTKRWHGWHYKPNYSKELFTVYLYKADL